MRRALRTTALVSILFAVIAATKKNTNATNDTAASFFDDCCLLTGAAVKAKLYDAYVKYCQSNVDRYLSKIEFGDSKRF